MKILSVLLSTACILGLSCERENSTDAGAAHSVQAPAKIEGFSLLPEKNVVALTPANFCAGIKNVKALSKQTFTDEVAVLCNNATPTPMFNSLMANAYNGVGTQNLTEIIAGETGQMGQIQILAAYAMRINKPAVPLLLAEEPYINVANYNVDGFKMEFKFVAPPANENDCDTGFRIEQFSQRSKQPAKFDDTSIHDLKLYRLFPNNFDFMMAVRSIVTPTVQFKKSIALRAVMTDPTDPKKAYSVTVLNLTMNGRGEEDRMIETVMAYIRSDMRSVYTYHNQ